MKALVMCGMRTFVGVALLCLALPAMAQDAEQPEVDKRPVRSTFESIWIIDNATVDVPFKGTFEFDIQHRFGVVSNGYEDFFGLYAPTNIRLGFGYVPVNNLMVGFGITKTNLTWDANARYAILRQTRSGNVPLSLTYYGNAAFDTRAKEFFANPDELEFADRVSFFHQLLVGRKFSDRFSAQVAGSLSHFNTVEAYEDSEGDVIKKYNNDHIAIAVSAKYQVANWVNIIFNYDQPITTHEVFDPESNIAFGIEFTSSSHQFQIFAGNFYNIVPQRNNVFNTNSFGDGDILIGFNITRLWNF